MDWNHFSNPQRPRPLTAVVEQGKRFESCVPVTFRFVRNVEKAPYLGGRFQQDIEPAGRYVVHNEDPGDIPSGWQTGIITLWCPLVLQFNTKYPDEVYGPHSWKAALRQHYGATGKALSKKLRALGYDGIVTTLGSAETREIVVL
jgi:hypothetical protein